MNDIQRLVEQQMRVERQLAWLHKTRKITYWEKMIQTAQQKITIQEKLIASYRQNIQKAEKLYHDYLEENDLSEEEQETGGD